MERRDFMLKAAAVAVTGLAAAACTTSATTGVTPASTADAGRSKRAEIDAKVSATLNRVRATIPGSSELLSKATGVLVFPSVIAAGLGVGGEYGEGALRIRNATTGYYSLASLSFGLQIGAQSKAVVFLLMTQEALDKFRSTKGWAAGVDASVAMVKVGANGAIEAASGPVMAFVLTNAGLMANLTVEGSKITPLEV